MADVMRLHLLAYQGQGENCPEQRSSGTAAVRKRALPTDPPLCPRSAAKPLAGAADRAQRRYSWMVMLLRAT